MRKPMEKRIPSPPPPLKKEVGPQRLVCKSTNRIGIPVAEISEKTKIPFYRMCRPCLAELVSRDTRRGSTSLERMELREFFFFFFPRNFEAENFETKPGENKKDGRCSLHLLRVDGYDNRTMGILRITMQCKCCA